MLPAPANLAMQIPGLSRYTLAEYFAISQTQQLGMYMAASVSNPRPVPGCTPEPDVCRDWRPEGLRARSFGSVPLAQMELNAGRVTLPVIGGDVEDPTSYTARNWASLQTAASNATPRRSPSHRKRQRSAPSSTAISLGRWKTGSPATSRSYTTGF